MTIEYRWAEGQYDRLPALAAGLVSGQVAVIATPGSTHAKLCSYGCDPNHSDCSRSGAIRSSLVSSSASTDPAKNLTGISMLAGEMTTKRLELLCELVPTAAAIAVLRNPISPTAKSETISLSFAARLIGRQILFVNAGSDHQIEAPILQPTKVELVVNVKTARALGITLPPS